MTGKSTEKSMLALCAALGLLLVLTPGAQVSLLGESKRPALASSASQLRTCHASTSSSNSSAILQLTPQKASSHFREVRGPGNGTWGRLPKLSSPPEWRHLNEACLRNSRFFFGGGSDSLNGGVICPDFLAT